MSGFISSRNNAYHVAEMTAKWELLKMAGEQITSGRGYKVIEEMIEGEDPDAKEKATMIQKVSKIADKSLDKALSELGVSDSEIQQMNTPKKKAVLNENINRMTRSLVAGMIQGCAVVRIAEGECGNDDYQIAVCVKYSPELQSLAHLIKQGGNGTIPMGKSKSARDRIMNMSTKELIGRFGVLQTFNEEGEMVIFGFGQAEIRSVSSRQSAAASRATSQARLEAVNNIKNFVAEDFVATEAESNIEKLDEYADGTNAYFSQKKLEQAIKSKETTLNIATSQVRQWRDIHPKSNTNVAGVVVAWTYSHSQQANQLKNQLNKTGSGIKGNMPRKKTVKGKITITGDDEDL